MKRYLILINILLIINCLSAQETKSLAYGIGYYLPSKGVTHNLKFQNTLKTFNSFALDLEVSYSQGGNCEYTSISTKSPVQENKIPCKVRSLNLGLLPKVNLINQNSYNLNLVAGIMGGGNYGETSTFVTKEYSPEEIKQIGIISSLGLEGTRIYQTHISGNSKLDFELIGTIGFDFNIRCKRNKYFSISPRYYYYGQNLNYQIQNYVLYFSYSL